LFPRGRYFDLLHLHADDNGTTIVGIKIKMSVIPTSPGTAGQPGMFQGTKAAAATVTEIENVDSELPDEPSPEQHDDTTPTFDLHATNLISSPYEDPANQLQLHDLTQPVRLLAFALTTLKPVRKDYATSPYLESFNWPAVFATLRKLCQQVGLQWQRQEIYLVIFRSKLQRNADRKRLGELDQKSHEEACASGGLLKYWFGSCDDDVEGGRRNLATCKGHVRSVFLVRRSER
jgi:hypothetical protein